MQYYIYDTIEQATSAINTINKGEGIDFDAVDVTNQYTDIKPTIDGKFAIIADSVTSKYITDRTAIETQIIIQSTFK